MLRTAYTLERYGLDGYPGFLRSEAPFLYPIEMTPDVADWLAGIAIIPRCDRIATLKSYRVRPIVRTAAMGGENPSTLAGPMWRH